MPKMLVFYMSAWLSPGLSTFNPVLTAKEPRKAVGKDPRSWIMPSTWETQLECLVLGCYGHWEVIQQIEDLSFSLAVCLSLNPSI